MKATAAALVIALSCLAGRARADAVEQELRALQQRLDAEGLPWKAGRTSMSQLAASERARRLGRGDSPLVEVPWAPRRHEPVTPRYVHPDAPVPDLEASRFSWADVDGQDWTTAVKDQGSCGSCAVFAATAVVEARANISLGVADADLDLSEQHLLSCTAASTCTTGTWDVTVLIPTLVERGIPDEACHPYTEANGQCQAACDDVDSRKLRVVSGGWLPSVGALWDIASVEDIKQALVAGPVLAAFVIPESFYHYVEGVFEDTPSPDAFLKAWHVVPIVGWDDHDDDDLPPSWICKNSWGTDWGQEGFFEIKRSSATRMGTQGTVIEVDARGVPGVLCPLPPQVREVSCDEQGCGAAAAFELPLKLCHGDAEAEFAVEAVGEGPAWLGAWPKTVAVGADAPAMFRLEVIAAELPPEEATHTAELVFIGQGGFSRRVPFTVTTRLATSETQADSATASDEPVIDSPPATDSEQADQVAADSPVTDASCGCHHAGGRVRGSLVALLSFLVS